ncbi:hypothetical protein HJFPF1_00923 [Paramyrothecium foliicola]|nr:hypothetical protein HJFPF1_00923 [Paramyrothecium foliicola]
MAARPKKSTRQITVSDIIAASSSGMTEVARATCHPSFLGLGESSFGDPIRQELGGFQPVGLWTCASAAQTMAGEDQGTNWWRRFAIDARDPLFSRQMFFDCVSVTSDGAHDPYQLHSLPMLEDDAQIWSENEVYL